LRHAITHVNDASKDRETHGEEENKRDCQHLKERGTTLLWGSNILRWRYVDRRIASRDGRRGLWQNGGRSVNGRLVDGLGHGAATTLTKPRSGLERVAALLAESVHSWSPQALRSNYF
jgi:hypothetical protein